ncbi:MAG: hypothetical protein OEZ04_12315, partial [Nitrospinota bacterium]|nr:hypothetical protein [Nitrospinota bacterium]
MAADLTIPGTTGRKSFLLMDDALVMLEHGGMRDRVTKILYEHIETILVWKKMPWIKIILTAVFLGGLALLFLREAEKGNEAFRTSAEILAAALIVAEAVIIIMKTTYLRIIHEGAVFE